MEKEKPNAFYKNFDGPPFANSQTKPNEVQKPYENKRPEKQTLVGKYDKPAVKLAEQADKLDVGAAAMTDRLF